MSEIKLLKPEIYNIIAAGEVIENPMGAVKELVENSIDAGASRITIEVVRGGFELISVTDDGAGIREDEVELAFVKYATSKITSASDMYALQTLGFRGEALPSIAAISRIKLTTRTRSAEMGVCVDLEDGHVTHKQHVACNVGTKIEVRGLYHSIPVKKNFFKSERGEAASITKYVSHLILTNPQLQVTYTLDGELIYSTKGEGLKEAIFAVYGADCLSHCLEVSMQGEGIRIFGYIGDPQISKPNKTYQTLAVNGRYIEDQSISSTISQAYRSNIMARQYPFFVLHLEIPLDQVDVNVHPKKLLVKFADQHKVCSSFYNMVLKAIGDYKAHGFDSIVAPQPQAQTSFQENFLNSINALELEETNPDQANDINEVERATAMVDSRKSFDEIADLIEQELSVKSARMYISQDDYQQVEHEPLAVQPQDDPVARQQIECLSVMGRTRVLGIAFKTYLMLELEDKVLIIDQHAAHERLIFDRMMARDLGVMQPLVVPYVFTVKEDEALFIEENMDSIFASGIEIEAFGRNTYRISAVSSLLEGTDMDVLVQFLLGSMEEYKVDDKALIMQEIAKRACKAAVKAGCTLSEYEVMYIANEVYNNRIMQCPHGRPVIVTLTRKDFEKMFKRIV